MSDVQEKWLAEETLSRVSTSLKRLEEVFDIACARGVHSREHIVYVEGEDVLYGCLWCGDVWQGTRVLN